MDYALFRSKRKTIAIYIRDGTLEVRAPLKCPKPEIDSFVASKEKWITDRLAASQKQAAQREAFVLDYGDELCLRGVLYPIVEKAGARAGFDGEVFYLPPGLDSQQIRDACVQVYRRLAKTHLADRVDAFARQMDVQPTAVKINGAKGRWGSCSSRKSINFSWRLIMADDDVIDYVVVHELAHITHMNHSKRFWAEAEGVLPDYRERRTRLNELQKRLASEDWG